MKVIDLLNKIANGEEVPKKIRIPSVYRVSLTYDEIKHDYKFFNSLMEDYEYVFSNCYFYDDIKIHLDKIVKPVEETEIDKLHSAIVEVREILCDLKQEIFDGTRSKYIDKALEVLDKVKNEK